MTMRDVFYRAQFGAVAVIVASVNITAAFATEVSSDSLKLAPGLVKAPGYETPATSYVVANTTSIYSDHSYYDTKVTGELKRGDYIDVLAKVKGWKWGLIG